MNEMNETNQEQAPLNEGELVDVAVEALISDGRALGRVNGMVLLMADALPGQTVRVRVTSVRRRLAEGQVEAVLTPSPSQRPAACPHEECGGCAWQTLLPEAQHHWKERLVADALARIGHFPDPLPLRPLLASPREWGYRNKMEFAFGLNREGHETLGLRERRSHCIVPVTDCLLPSPLTMDILAWLRQAVAEMSAQEDLHVWDPESRSGFWRYVVIRQASETPAGLTDNSASESGESAGFGESGESGAAGEARPANCLVELIVAAHPAGIEAMVSVGKRLADGLRAALPCVAGFALSERAAWSDVAYGEKIRYTRGATQLVESVGSVPCVLTPQVFMQVNTEGAGLLYAEAARMLGLSGVEVVWDLYCGSGAIGLSLAPFASEVHGVDVVPQAITQARATADRMGFENCRFHAGDALHMLRKFPAPSVVVVDPPRAGLQDTVIRALLKSGATKILYMSCNPATFARDAALFATTYKLTAVQPVDMFPQTPHVELAGLFERL